jgi:two-component system phosphate regulon sensor histidine kinase PhoR
VDVGKLMDQLLREARPVGRQARDHMEVDGPDVLGSYEELHSAFGNLASNAVRYTPAGGKIHLVWKEFEAAPSSWWKIPASASARNTSRA